MPLKNTESRWGGMAQSLHWLMALGILGNGVLGLIMDEMPRGMTKLNTFAIHKSIGLTVLALLILRVSWRLFDRAPPDEPMPRWQRLAAHATHGVLYLLMLAIPLSGWIYNSLHGYPLQWFKWFNLPALMEKNEALSDIAGETHEVLFFVLLAVLAAHVGGALVHHWFERDNTLLRMLPFVRLRKPGQGDSP
ncbi:cytochrome b [Dokdonella immobilis]|uniref:Cytochrome b561 n=1 Tax=Dokdonella immobilis TaxID=578942 RepID=A0A1I4WCZ3_9GAMM|nr:cytochrome b [Dokdonella immobilis]SFN11528.1 cytochrome b561 [Dokdonella immobilis]